MARRRFASWTGRSRAGWARGSDHLGGSTGSLRVTYAVTPQRIARVRPRQPTDDAPPRAAVTAALAELAGGVGAQLPLRIGGEPVNVAIAAVVDRFPGTRGDAVIADLGALETAIDTVAPGRAPVSSSGWTWPRTRHAGRGALAGRPFAVLEKDSRREVEEDARRDPLGHGTARARRSGARGAPAGGHGLALAIRADLRDDRGELVDLEAQGATPALLRRVVTSRAALVALTGALVGALAGVVLAYLVTRVVSVTARADTPEPPLATTVDPVSILLGGIAVAIAAGARRARDPPRVRRSPRTGSDRRRVVSAPLVDLRDVFVVHPSVDGGVAALRGMTLAVERGELCVVLGPSGSGKSTLVRVVAGLQRPSAGLALVDGIDVGTASGAAIARLRARVVGYADQHYWRALSSDLTASELVGLLLGLAAPPAPTATVARRSCSSASASAIGRGAAPRAVRRRAAADRRCAAVAHAPALLLADEPTGELDEASARDVLDLLAELAREEGATALVVSHDPASAAVADRVVHVRDGRIGEERRVDEEGTVVIGRGGWLRVPEETLQAAGIGDRAVVHLGRGVVELRPAGAAPPEAPGRTHRGPRRARSSRRAA